MPAIASNPYVPISGVDEVALDHDREHRLDEAGDHPERVIVATIVRLGSTPENVAALAW